MSWNWSSLSSHSISGFIQYSTSNLTWLLSEWQCASTRSSAHFCWLETISSYRARFSLFQLSYKNASLDSAILSKISTLVCPVWWLSILCASTCNSQLSTLFLVHMIRQQSSYLGSLPHWMTSFLRKPSPSQPLASGWQSVVDVAPLRHSFLLL